MLSTTPTIRRIVLAVLLLCTAFLVCSIAADPLGKHDVLPALAVTIGFIALGKDPHRKQRAAK